MLTEVPLVFPTLEASTVSSSSSSVASTTPPSASFQGNYQCHETDGLVRIGDQHPSSLSAADTTTTTTITSVADDTRLKGLASIAHNADQSTTVITTASSAQWLQIITCTSLQSQQSFWQLDISQWNIIHVKSMCSVNPETDQEEWTLMLVDTDGVLWIMELTQANDGNRWLPQNNVRVISVPEILRKQQQQQYAASSNWGLTTERVVILDTQRVLLATATQGLLSVDWTTEQVYFWSKKVQPPSNTNTSMLGYIFGSSANQQPQRIDPEDALAPVVSMTVVNNDATTVFSLHDNGHLYQWSIHEGAIYPHTLHPMSLDKFPLDEQDTAWSEDSAPTTLTAHAYKTTDASATAVCVAVFVPNCSLPPSTTTSWNTNAMDSGAAGDSSMLTIGPRFLVAATTDDGESIRDLFSQSLVLPEEPCLLVGAQWVSNSSATVTMATTTSMTTSNNNNNTDNRPQLHAWIARQEAAATSLLQYGPSNDLGSLVQKTPVIGLDEEGSVDYLARQEKWILEQWSALQNEVQPSPDLFQAIDQSFLQLLFRPAMCRGVGHALPPRPVHIRSAIQKCLPSSFSISNKEDDHRLPLQVLNAMQFWRKWAARRSAQTRTTTSTSTNTPLRGDNNDPNLSFTSARSLYESVQQAAQNEEMDNGEDAPQLMDTDGTDVSMADLQDYENMWRELLLQIWQEEEADRLPLSFGQGWIVRAGNIAQLQFTYESKPAEIDRAARKVVVRLEENGSTAVQLQKLEQHLWASFSVPSLGQGDGFSSVMAETARQVMKEMASIAQEGLMVIPRNELSLLESSLKGNVDELAKNIQKLNMGVTVTDTIQQLGAVGTTESTAAVTVQQRLAAAGMCARRLDAARQLFLGRFLVLSGLQAREKILEAAWLGYLRAISLLVASSNHVPMLRPAITSTLSDVGDENSHARKRQSLDTSKQQSILGSIGIRDTTTAMDSFLLAVFKRTNVAQLDSVIDAAMECMFRTQGTKSFPFPELRFIAPYDEVAAHAALEQPKLALILHAPMLVADGTSIYQQERLESTAECILRLYKNYSSNVSDCLLDRVFSILHFDAQNLGEGFARMKKLLGITSQKAVDHIFNAIRKVQELEEHEYLSMSKNDDFISLLSQLFHKSLLTGDWDKALFSCKEIPSRRTRIEMLHNLAKSMVENGALSRLISLCSSHGQKEHEFVQGKDLYTIACESLSNASSRDLYYLKAKESDQLTDRLTDYQGALYALHISRNEWRKAAEAMDLRFVNARRALASNLAGEDEGVQNRRTQLILEDLVLAATGGYNALCNVKNKDLQFIISGEYGKLPKLTIDDETEEMNHKRQRDSPKQKKDKSKKKQHRLFRYKDLDDSQTRALVATGVYKLWLDGCITKSLAEQFLSEEEDPSRTIQVLIRELILCGHFDQGLTLALHLKDTMPGRAEGSGIFQETLYYLTCDHLVPIVLYGPAHDACISSPTLAQLYSALDATLDKPPVLAGQAPNRSEDAEESAIRIAAMALLESITTRYTSSELPLAQQVAQCIMLDHDRSGVEMLPKWLSSLLTVGQRRQTDTPGLFAQRNKGDENLFMGDPSALLEIYISRGAYHLACNMVSTLLADPDRAKKAASRLPEKGDMEVVPYSKVDMLYNLIEAAMEQKENGPIRDEQMRMKVLSSRDDMVKALEQHFALLELSEKGIRAARAMAHP